MKKGNTELYVMSRHKTENKMSLDLFVYFGVRKSAEIWHFSVKLVDIRVQNGPFPVVPLKRPPKGEF